MPEKFSTLTEMLNSWVGGAGTTMIGALIGRLMWHTNEVKKDRRKFFGKELLWELPIAIGMAIIGEGLSRYLGLAQPVSTGLIAALAYLGPRGAEVLLMKWSPRWVGK
ncbi:phage holin family protein [Ciceribacter ferrooxidans]|uniref:LydA holin phage, holin superfamily III n=1 Tax=Ciceribacter ferrooxidans TaxID=2509717 RepID=A0A4Q2SZZ0_9HYPH|nr:phage holin family protein [Ciceribacter ferrooxidans]RYC10190.1 hypothetical protein EUU22_19180 [Ciceribacter ferrooxidans]